MSDEIPETIENSNVALQRLRDILREARFIQGGKLPAERVLADELGVGRRDIRRALEVLEAEGLIWRKQGAGTFLGQRPDHWSEHAASLVNGTNFMEIMEVRLRIEPQLAQMAALRATGTDIERMRQTCAKIYESHDADWRELWDGAFHRLIAQSAGNLLFLSLFDVVNKVRQDASWQEVRQHARERDKTVQESHRQHSEIIDAIAARDPMRAGEAMRRHLLSLLEHLIRVTSLDHPNDPFNPSPPDNIAV